MKQEKTFEDFLAEKHGDNYYGTDDMMSDDYSEWLRDLDIDDVIKYADEYAIEERRLLMGKIDELDRNSEKRTAELECSQDGYEYGVEDTKQLLLK